MENLTQNLIGTTLKGSVSGEDASFKVINVVIDNKDVYMILECIEFGCPLIRRNINTINNPVRA